MEKYSFEFKKRVINNPKQCRVTLFGKEKLMLCTCHCRQEQIAAEKQLRKEQQHLDRIPRLKANGLHDKALLAYTFVHYVKSR